MRVSIQISTLLAIQTRPESDQIEYCKDGIEAATFDKWRAKYLHLSVGNEELFVTLITGHESPTWLKKRYKYAYIEIEEPFLKIPEILSSKMKDKSGKI